VSMDRPTTGRTLWRRLALGAGPLKRSSDRLQFLARVLLGCTLLMALPIALAVGTATHSQAQAEAVAQAAERQLVDATLTEDAPAAASSNNEIVAPKVRVAIMWTGPYGVEREGHVAVPAGTRAGEVVHIWIDGEGRPTLRPLSEGDVTARSIGVAMLTYLCLALVACGLYLAFRTTLDRGRLRRWDADWAVVEPVWTRTVP
jgi:hypothetical protein